jgi:acyl-CoA dehydrogenase
MELQLSDEGRMVLDSLHRFLSDRILPAERSHDAEVQEVPIGEDTPSLQALRREARELGLWNLYLQDPEWGSGIGPLDYALLCEAMGGSAIAPRAFNCDAPDAGNADTLLRYGSEAQKELWLRPLLDGEIRSCFSMTEPDSSGSDPTGLRTRAVRDGSDWVIDGHKWFTTGAIGARFAIVMAVTDPHAAPHRRASMFIVPVDTPGFHLVRNIPAMGDLGGGSHCEIAYRDCRVPADALLGPENEGFAIAQSRLGPGRIHQCMRAIGMAERAFGILCRHANVRETRGTLLADTQFIQHWVARSRLEITQARLLTHHAALKLEQEGSHGARHELAMTKAVVPRMLMAVLDRTMQALGALGMSDDTPVAAMWRTGRTMRIADGPDEVHEIAIARRELAAFR